MKATGVLYLALGFVLGFGIAVGLIGIGSDRLDAIWLNYEVRLLEARVNLYRNELEKLIAKNTASNTR